MIVMQGTLVTTRCCLIHCASKATYEQYKLLHACGNPMAMAQAPRVYYNVHRKLLAQRLDVT